MHRLLFRPLKRQRVSAIVLVLVLVLVTRCSICVTHASKVPSYICFPFTNSRCLLMYVVIVVRVMVCFFVRPMHSLTAWWGLTSKCLICLFQCVLVLQNSNTWSQNYTTTSLSQIKMTIEKLLMEIKTTCKLWKLSEQCQFGVQNNISKNDPIC